jgi:hypothetical protein
MESLLDFETVEAVLGESFGQQVGIKWFILCLTVLWRVKAVLGLIRTAGGDRKGRGAKRRGGKWCKGKRREGEGSRRSRRNGEKWDLLSIHSD